MKKNITLTLGSFLSQHKGDLVEEGVSRSLKVAALASRGVLACKENDVLCTSPDQLAVIVETTGVRAGVAGPEFKRT